MIKLPGTALEIEDGRLVYGFANLSSLFSVTGGLTLSQICEIAGTELTTVQNWIKRGWVAHPENKRYKENHLARIIILNMLRNSLQLEQIAIILRYINGSADDRNDDIIPDSTLYSHLCIIVDKVVSLNITDEEGIKNCVSDALTEYSEPYEGAKEKLISALTVMTLAFIASEIKLNAERIFKEIIE
ncbi:MAG: DUF1836 domain-containing protein [Oscillospiraceae bacterium]|nr:DUF1836 domain-containing protein [Oscillospiraceae bacterium]